MRAPRWASAPHLRPRTVRLRLTALYGALFLACGAALLAITYVLVEHSSSVLTFRSKNGTVGAVLPGGGHSPDRFGAQVNAVQRGAGPHPKGLPSAKQMLKLAEQQHRNLMHQLLLDSGIALAVMAVLAIGLGWLVAGRVLRPLRTITGAVREISATNLHRRLAMNGPRDELTELGDTFDGLLARLETAFHAQRQFVANASHELRTPLARQRAIGQVALADPNATAESLRAAHERVLAAGTQQERIILALLALARGQAGLVRSERVDLAELADRVLTAREGEAELRGVVVDVALEPAATQGDPRLLDSLIANLVDNGLRYNAEFGRLTVSTATSDGLAVLTVSNTGPQVPPDEVSGLLQPFHRLPAQRGAYADGLGVGLSIVSAVAAAHDARLEIRTQPGGGLCVEVRFPVLDGNAVASAGTSTGDHAVVLH